MRTGSKYVYFRFCLQEITPSNLDLNVAPELRTVIMITGLALLLASVIAGALWDAIGPQATFLGGAAITILTLAGLLPVRKRLRGVPR